MARTSSQASWMSLIAAMVLLSALMVAAVGCKTQDKAGVKDEASDGIAATLPKGMIQKRIDAADIGKYVQPGTGRNGVPHTMDGIWWTNAKTVHFLASFRNAYWDKDKRAASLLFVGPGTYTNRADDHTPKDYLVPISFGAYDGYDIVFSEDGKMAWLLTAATDDNNDRVQEQTVADTPYTMEWKEANHWTRHSKGQPDYELRRIIDADGKEDPVNFPLYVADWANGAVVYQPTLIMDDKQKTLQIPVTSDQPIYVQAYFSGFYDVTNDGQVPATLYAADKKGSSQAKAGSPANMVTLAGNGTSEDDSDSAILLVVTPDKGARGTLTLTAAPTPSVQVLSLTTATTVELPKDGTPKTVAMPSKGLPPGSSGAVYRFKVTAAGPTNAVIHYDSGTIETKALAASDDLLIIVSSSAAMAYLELSNATGGGTVTLTPSRIPVTFADKQIVVDAPATADKLASFSEIHCYTPTGKVPGKSNLYFTLTGAANPPALAVSATRLGSIGPDPHPPEYSGKYYGILCVQYQVGLNQPAQPLDYTLELTTTNPKAGKS